MPSGKRVLLIDDDHEILRGTQLRLRAEGYDTLQANDGAAGVELAIANRPDAIILDLRMPGMDGLKTLAALRQNAATREIPVVMLSASPRDEEPALNAGARYFLAKPYQGRTLVAAVRQLIRADAAQPDPASVRRTARTPGQSPATWRLQVQNREHNKESGQ